MFIYMEPEVEFSLKEVENPQSLCELVNLSEKYQIQKLNAKAKSTLKDMSVTEENFIYTATTAKHYTAFEDVSKMLTSKCQLFLKQSLRSAEDVYSFIVKTRTEFPEFDMEILFDLLKTRNGDEGLGKEWTTIFAHPDERQIPGRRALLTTLPRIGNEWRVAFKFKPTSLTYSGISWLALDLKNFLQIQF